MSLAILAMCIPAALTIHAAITRPVLRTFNLA